jgi:sulfatase maturation enzyme AslB (radical SAM superfamily)
MTASESPAGSPRVELRRLDTLWFQISGTLCNLACAHCLVSSSPTNRTHEMLTAEQVRPYLEEGPRLGVREYYFTGGEPFLNPEMEQILEETLAVGPATVLTNGLLLNADRCRRLRAVADASEYSLDLRVSLDGYDAETNDPIRGAGTFDRVLRGIGNLVAAGLNPVITVTEACSGASTEDGRRRFFEMLGELGIGKPRLKILPVFRIGAEVERSGSYQDWQTLRAGDSPDGWDHLQCSSCRMVTARGVWVCPILVNEPGGRMGEALADTLEAFPLDYQACWTCHVEGATCRT